VTRILNEDVVGKPPTTIRATSFVGTLKASIALRNNWIYIKDFLSRIKLGC